MLRKLAFGAAIGALLAVPASATTAFYSFSVDGSSDGLGTAPYGTVSVMESGGSLVFTETLASGYKIHDGNSNHNAFNFSLLGDPTVSITNLTSGFAVVTPAGASAPPFGNFDYAIDCTTACGSGYNGGFAGTLSFTVTSSAGALTIASLASNMFSGTPIYFASDLVNANGTTGNVGATLTISSSPVPEPATWAMFIGGFGLVGGTMRRRQRIFARLV